MIIKKIELRNFRSYYKDNKFDLTNGLNLIIGSNGDGKTTFFEALEWLFKTDGTNKMDERLISKKREEELDSNQSDNVKVSMTYEQDGRIKALEKEFRFTKSSDDSITTHNYSFTLTEGNGVERKIVDGAYFDHDIAPEIRRYIMFKGEDDLDVLQRSNALKILIQTFSDVKDFDAYFKFMEYATMTAEKASENAQRLDKKNSDKIRKCRRIIDTESGILSDIEKEIEQKQKVATDFESLIKSIEQSKEASKLLRASKQRISNLQNERAEKARLIHEDYTINLLDDMWVLMGFDETAKEFVSKVSASDLERRKQEQDYLLKAGEERGEKKALKKLKVNFVPLSANIPGPKVMQEMLDEEVCKVCGRPAKKHSEPWEFMYHKLQEYYESLKSIPEDDEQIAPLYKNNYIKELMNRVTSLTDNLSNVTTLRHIIQDRIALNNRLHNDIKKIDANLDREFEIKKRILAQADGLTEEQLEANYEKISNWHDQKDEANNRIENLKRKREEHRTNLEEARDELSKLAEGTSAEIYTRIWNIIRQISDAFKTAKDDNKNALLDNIQSKANHYLDLLNANDFKGRIAILEKNKDGQGEALLLNDDGTRIFNPNTALKTTYLMSVLFAISKLSSEKKDTEFPLIFDAPTSSFTPTKEAEFFNVISKLDKQVIIVTKSFLKDIGNDKVSLDNERVEKIDGTVYHIEKKKPFDDKKLGTIQTIITKIK